MAGEPRSRALLWAILILLVVLIALVIVAVLWWRPAASTSSPDLPAQAQTPVKPLTVVAQPAATDDDLDGILAPAAVPGIQILRSLGYQVGYEAARQRPRWAVYSLPAHMVEPGKQPDRPRWTGDTRVPDPTTDQDWVGCGERGYDRGHLAPSDALWSRFGRAGWQGTYVLTNAVPERKRMNGGRWAQLEALLAGRGSDAGLAGHCAYLAVAVIPIYDDAADVDGDGEGRDTMHIRRPIEIPDAVAAIALDRIPTGYRVWAWLTPNTDAGEMRRVSVDEIERLSRLDVNDELPADEQAVLEAGVAPLP